MEHPLTAYRKKHGLSREALAKLVGTSRQSIHRIEMGDQTPSLTLVGKLVLATGGAIRADDFLSHEDAA